MCYNREEEEHENFSDTHLLRHSGEPGGREKLEAFADQVVYNPYTHPLSEEELIPLLEDVDGYIAGVDYVTAKALTGANRLKVISRYGIGVDGWI